MHRKMRSGYKNLIEKLQKKKIFLVETYEYEEVKNKAVHEGVRGNGDMAPTIPNLGNRWRGVSFPPKRS